ncbi:hypothetical protein D9756_001387 [Leucocoprinus leucothites]|uniref:Protein kinase domain-containing protein n=1 Tax=Leucocoprinus leucothites TaxID=201217 RepID=A0A8H5G3W3_9AGAR|nr:hypothetical protein D9756_001387 [Leucoagaricus leucothites]
MADSSREEATTPKPSIFNESDVFATLHHLVSRIDTENRVDEVAERAQDLNAEETQLLVDCLSMSLDQDAAPLKSRLYVWRTLIKVASSAKLFAQSHTLNSEHVSLDDSGSPNAYRVSGEVSVRVKVMRQASENDGQYTKVFINWVHMSHQNILPLYAVFLNDEDHPCLVSPCNVDPNICDYIRDNPDISRMPLISDIANGLSYIHQLDMVHGGLNPESVLVSSDGQAVITDLDLSDSPPVRYSAPELLADDEIEPTKAIDMWAFACLCYELLSGRVPFSQIAKDIKVAAAIALGSKPTRPGITGASGNKIDDAMWQIMLMCWEIEPANRPECLTIQQMLMGMVIQDSRPTTDRIIQPEVMKKSTVDLEHAKASLTQVFGADHSPSPRVPEHLRKMLSSFFPDTTRLNATAAAAKKLGPNDTQIFVDFLDLLLEDLPTEFQSRASFVSLLSTIMTSTHVLPHRYKLTGIQYDPIPTSEGPDAKAYKGRGLDIRVNAVTSAWCTKTFHALLPSWFHTSHPNIIPFYGVFYEGAGESPRLCVVTSLWTNGFLEDYALALPQKSRIPLISDVVNGMAYLHDQGLGFSYVHKEDVMISDNGQAVLTIFNTAWLFTTEDPSPTRGARFFPPGDNSRLSDDIWSFGCFCYVVVVFLQFPCWCISTNKHWKVLSRKEPYHQLEEYDEIRSAISRGEPPKRPDSTDSDVDEIDDQAWDLISKCCRLERSDRLTASAVKQLIQTWEVEDNRPPVKGSPENSIFAMRSRPNVDFHHMQSLLGKIQVELLRSPLSKLLQNHIKDVTSATADLASDDIRTLVDFLDLALKDYLSIAEEQNRVLALLSRITSSTHIFPQRYELKGIKYSAQPMAEGGYGAVHRATDINVCVKVMAQVDPKALTPWIRELILWAHASHPNILPFCGVLLENVNNSQRICLVSPFMKNGNLRTYAPRLPQKSRLSLILDVANGLHYLHGLGILHGDLKGENVLISNEGRCLITDFGTTQITTATAAATASLVPTTLRFAAPEVVLSSGASTKERDIWSFGCLCYETLSRQVPCYQYAQNVQVSAALARKEIPRRPGSISPTEGDDDDWDDDEDDDWDEIDDQAWGLITKCCVPEPEDRLSTSAVQELIIDMKVWDDRPAAKAVLGTEISKLRANPEIDLNRVGELLDMLQKKVVPTEEGDVSDFIDLFNSMVLLPSVACLGSGPAQSTARKAQLERTVQQLLVFSHISKLICSSPTVQLIDMAEISKEEATTPNPGIFNESDVFATLHHLVSRIDNESRVDEVAERAQDLNTEETQLLIDCLSMSLDQDAAPLKSRLYVWRTLIKVASSAKLFAQSHTLNSEHISMDDPGSPSTYRVSGEAPVSVKVVRQAENENDGNTETLIGCAHLSHQNILPLYAVFLNGGEYPCLVSLHNVDQTICDYIRDNPSVSRMPLISDIVNGLSYIHQLDMVHGGLNPESVLVSSDGQAMITDLNPSDSPPVRYSAPELLEDDEIQPTKAIDMWAFACLCYELLSDKVPFSQITKDIKVSAAIARGSKPTRPGVAGAGGNEIDDAMWQIMLMCWEIEPANRPECLTIQQMLMGMVIQDSRPTTKQIIQPKKSTVDLEHAKARLTRVFGADHSPSPRVPEHLRKLLSSFFPDTAKLNATAAAAKKLGPNDTQIFVDFLDLLLEDLPIEFESRVSFVSLLSSIMLSTHVLPHRYKLTGIQYDPIPISEGPDAKAYKGRGLNIRVNAVTSTWRTKGFLALLPNWFHTSHPNIIPFYGVFHEGAGESPRLCVITSHWVNGLLEDYAPTLPQKYRLPLISDVVNGMAYLHDRGIEFCYVNKGDVVISDNGQAVLAVFNSTWLFAKEVPPTREVRFLPPGDNSRLSDDIWSFGCFCYVVLSRKEPYHQLEEYDEIRSAISRGELPKRPDSTDNDIDEIDDQAWDLITRCCRLERSDRPTALEVKESIQKWEVEDNRTPVKGSPENSIFAMRSRPNVDFHHMESLLGKIQVELLRSPLSKLLQNHIKDVTSATTDLASDDIRTLVDFLDLALKDHLSIAEEQNRVLALLSRITSSTHIFPQRYELKGIKYSAQPMAEGGYGAVHRATDINVCVKVMAQVDPKALTPWIRELILWAHASHRNILPFCGVLLENVNNSQRICLVSPFMKNGNMRIYAPRLPQKSRLSLILDVAEGLHYLHGLGILHGDLKGENVLISNEGRCLITDFGTTHITTVTAAATASLVPTTLRFAAPEVVLSSGASTKERDIWSFGCLCYETLSRQVPYYQYAQNVQVSAALARKEVPRRPGSVNPAERSDDDWDDDEDDDWDEIDDQAWGLITKCCAPEPEDRLSTSAVQELIIDMKVWDDRPAAKAVLGTEISKLRANPEIDLNRVGELLDILQKKVVPSEVDDESDFVDLFNSMVQLPS